MNDTSIINILKFFYYMHVYFIIKNAVHCPIGHICILLDKGIECDIYLNRSVYCQSQSLVELGSTRVI